MALKSWDLPYLETLLKLILLEACKYAGISSFFFKRTFLAIVAQKNLKNVKHKVENKKANKYLLFFKPGSELVETEQD